MKTSRQKYFEDYRAEKETANNKKGYKIVYTYKGEWYGWNEAPTAIRKRKIFYVVALLACTALLLLCGAQRVYLNTVGVVASPGLISLVSVMYTWIGTVQFCLTKELVRAKECKTMYSFIEKGSVVTALCYSISTISSVYLLFRHGADLTSVLVTLGFALCAGISFSLYYQHEKLSYKKQIEAEREDSESGDR